jgi:DNA-binding transcriptional ArsR family regulator
MKKEILEFHAEFCKIFTHPKRLEILDLLILEELTVDELAAKLSLSKTSVYQHLRIMRMLRILKTRRNGTELHYMLANNKISRAYRLMQDALVQVMKGSVDTATEAVAAMKGEITR